MYKIIKPNNPFAFPYADDLNLYSQNGMTLRDYFANSVAQSIICQIPKASYLKKNRDKIASEAYNMADAMLKAREQ